MELGSLFSSKKPHLGTLSSKQNAEPRRRPAEQGRCPFERLLQEGAPKPTGLSPFSQPRHQVEEQENPTDACRGARPSLKARKDSNATRGAARYDPEERATPGHQHPGLRRARSKASPLCPSWPPRPQQPRGPGSSPRRASAQGARLTVCAEGWRARVPGVAWNRRWTLALLREQASFSPSTKNRHWGAFWGRVTGHLVSPTRSLGDLGHSSAASALSWGWETAWAPLLSGDPLRSWAWIYSTRSHPPPSLPIKDQLSREAAGAQRHRGPYQATLSSAPFSRPDVRPGPLPGPRPGQVRATAHSSGPGLVVLPLPPSVGASDL